MKDQLISIELNKLAKEKEFIHKVNHPVYLNDEWEENWIETLPTQSLLKKWLRKKHNIHVEPLWVKDHGEDTYDVGVYQYDDETSKYYSSGHCEYEEALEAGLVEAFKLIK